MSDFRRATPLDTSLIHRGSTSPAQDGVHREIIISVPDLTGKITKEGDYPAAREGVEVHLAVSACEVPFVPINKIK